MTPQINRRAILKHGIGALAGTVSMGVRARRSSAAEPVLPIPANLNGWQKHGIVLEATEPWEQKGIQSFTSPSEPLDGDRWRIWYSAVGTHETGKYSIAYAEGVPGEPMKKFPVQCSTGQPGDGPFTLGPLPEKWRPVQVVHVPLRNGKHRIYFWAHGPGILRYLAADSDDGHRYRVVDPHRPVLYHFHDRAAWGVASPDGVMLHKEPSKERPADEPIAPSHLLSNDATNIYQLRDGSFEMYSVALIQVPKDDPAYMPHDNAPGLIRLVDRYASEDGLHFEKRQRVIDRDAKDPPDQQFYYLSVTHTDKGRIGMLGHYRCQAQTMDLEWCFSKDGLKWERPRRAAWIPRGDKTQPDSYGIYAPSYLVHRGGRYHLFYTAVNSAHNGKDSHGPPRCLIMHATIDDIGRP